MGNSITSDLLVITAPFQNDAWTMLVNFLKVLKPLCNEIFLITGLPEKVILDRKIHLLNIRYDTRKSSVFMKILKYVALQVVMACKTFQVLSTGGKKLNTVIFFLGATFLFPMLVTKFFKKKTLIVSTGSFSRSIKEVYMVGPIFYPFVMVLEKINYVLSNKIVCYSENLVWDLDLERYANKISIAPNHFLDFTKFKIEKEFNSRNNLIGYVGRLSEEKGIINFVRAIPEVLKQRPNLEFLIIGDGLLRETLEKFIERNRLDHKVKMLGWVSHETIPSYLNELKLLVLPSYTEGLPNVMLEAIACGAIVLATPVGAVPAIIKDGETGFLMEDNSPECIARNILKALNHPNLSEIINAAIKLVEIKYTFEKAVNRYKIILENVRRF
ncbi:MAG: glycosyltransferase family 4 protein [Nitrososphaerota archaeon]